MNTFDQVGLAEVDDEATLQPSRLELREELGQEMIVRMLNRLELDNDFSKYEKVEFLAFDDTVLVDNVDGLLSLVGNASQL